MDDNVEVSELTSSSGLDTYLAMSECSKLKVAKAP